MKNLKAIIVGILVAVGATVAQASWTTPTQAPPLGNILPAINTSSTSQVKSGGLSVETFIVQGKSMFLGGTQFGTTTTPSDVYIEQFKTTAGTPPRPVCVDTSSGKLVICP